MIYPLLNQFATYWAPAAPDANGQPTWLAPVQLRCRWQDVHVTVVRPQGDIGIAQAIVTNAIVYLLTDVEPKGYMLKAKLVDVVDAVVPTNNLRALEIRMVDKTTDVKAREYLRKVYL